MLQIPANLLGPGCPIPSRHFKRLSLNLDALQTSRTKNCKTTLAANNRTSIWGHAAEVEVRVQKRGAGSPLFHQRYQRPLLGHKASPGKGQDSCPSEAEQPSLRYGQRKVLLTENMEAHLHASVAVGLTQRTKSYFCLALESGADHLNSSCSIYPLHWLPISTAAESGTVSISPSPKPSPIARLSCSQCKWALAYLHC